MRLSVSRIERLMFGRPRKDAAVIDPETLLAGRPLHICVLFPLRPAEMRAWSAWHPNLTQHGVIQFKRRCGTGVFGLIQGGLS